MDWQPNSRGETCVLDAEPATGERYYRGQSGSNHEGSERWIMPKALDGSHGSQLLGTDGGHSRALNGSRNRCALPRLGFTSCDVFPIPLLSDCSRGQVFGSHGLGEGRDPPHAPRPIPSPFRVSWPQLLSLPHVQKKHHQAKEPNITATSWHITGYAK